MFEPIEEIQINGVQDAENILKSIGFESADSLIEKAKWKVGDEKQYQGATWVVGGFNAKGTPLWRKKKDGGSAGGSVTPSTSTQTKVNQSNASAPTSSVKTDYTMSDFNKVSSSEWEIGSLKDKCKISIFDTETSGMKNMRIEVVDDNGNKKTIEFMGSYGPDYPLNHRNLTDDFAEKVMSGKVDPKRNFIEGLTTAKQFALKILNNRSKRASGSGKTTSSSKTNKTSGSSGIPTKEQALKKIDDFTSNFKINTFYSNRTPSWISNYAFNLSEKLRQEKFPWLDNIGVKEQILAMKYVIASSASGGAKEIAKNLNESKLGAKWQVESESPVIKLKTEDYMGNVSYLTISKHSKKSK